MYFSVEEVVSPAVIIFSQGLNREQRVWNPAIGGGLLTFVLACCRIRESGSNEYFRYMISYACCLTRGLSLPSGRTSGCRFETYYNTILVDRLLLLSRRPNVHSRLLFFSSP